MSKDVLYRYIFILFLLIPFFEPDYIIVTCFKIHQIYKIWQYISCCLIFILYIKESKISKFWIILLLYKLIILISTYINPNGEMFYSIQNMIQILALCSIIEYLINKKLHIEMFKVLNFIFQVLVYMNLLTMILYPNGLYFSLYSNNWLLGYDNLHIVTFIPAMTFAVICSYFKKNKIDLYTICFLLICNISVFIRMSANSLVCIIIFDLLLLISKKNILNNAFFKLKNYVIFYIIFFYSIIIYRIQNSFKWIIVDVLNKDLTFSGRTYIWDKVMDYVKKQPIIGYGVENTTIRTIKNGSISATHSHNHVLEVLYQGGYVGLVLFCTLMYLVIKEIRKNSKNYTTKIISIAIACFIIMMLVENRDKLNLYMLLCMGYNCKKLINH